MTSSIIVEPDLGIRRLQRLIIRQVVGTDEIVEVRSIAEALPIYASRHFNFAMVDISRPTDELRELLEISRKKQRSPVIAFTTAAVTRETLQLLVSDHVFAVFPKPFDLEAVIESVGSALSAEKAGTLHPRFFGFLQRGEEEQ
ncbi:MAG TPA: hypothetical protein VGF69_08200 [Thermoanaerobaculia bacterium]|jgi:DNA-binding NtrC family response regulator